MKQELVIPDWLPPPVTNTSRQRHWTVIRKEAHIAQTMAWASAKQASWRYVPGRVRLTITFVFSVKRTRDTDNLYARCKYVIDGLKVLFFKDDSTEWMDLIVLSRVEPGRKATEITLEALPASA